MHSSMCETHNCIAVFIGCVQSPCNDAITVESVALNRIAGNVV